MLRIFTYPTLMRTFVLNPIVDELISEFEDCEIKVDYSDSHVVIEHRSDVPDIFNRIMKSKSGFRRSRRIHESTIQWTHYMKPSARYDHNRANIILQDMNDHYEVFVSMIVGTHRRSAYRPTIFGVLSIVSFFLILGFTGSFEQDMITFPQYLTRAIICILMAIGFFSIEKWINPYDSVNAAHDKKIES